MMNNQKSFIIAAILAAAALSVFATPLAYAQDTSETSTDQTIKQKNVGSGESVNFNCAQNLYKAGAEQTECDFED
jgi:outer membrane protein assembly factor BamE (lipoprotein component of BamABCDE complex)